MTCEGFLFDNLEEMMRRQYKQAVERQDLRFLNWD